MTTRLPLFILLLWIFSGCDFARDVKAFSDFRDLSPGEPILVYSTDGVLYKLNSYVADDSMLSGRGERKEKGTWLKDSMSLRWPQIAYVQGRAHEFFRGTATAVFIGTFVAGSVEDLGSGPERKGDVAIRHYDPRSGGSGCPYIYAWDGAMYQMEGEALGTSLGRSLESNTAMLLHTARPVDGRIRVHLTNERPETHYLNVIGVRAVETNAEADVALDDNGDAWPVADRTGPVLARDGEGRDVLPLVRSADRQFWSPTDDVSEVTCAIVDRSRSREASMLVDCVNTPVAEGMMRFLSDFLGDAYLDFTYALDHDPAMLSLMEKFFEKNAIRVDVREGDGWREAGRFIQRGNAATFSRLLRVSFPERKSDTVWVRLRMRPDLWRIDAIAMDGSDARPMKAVPMTMRSARRSSGEDVSDLVGARDLRYAVLYPREFIDLEFDAMRGAAGKRIVYVADVRGYLYEWYIAAKPNLYTRLGKIIPESWKMGIVRYAMAKPGSHLPGSYEPPVPEQGGEHHE